MRNATYIVGSSTHRSHRSTEVGRKTRFATKSGPYNRHNNTSTSSTTTTRRTRAQHGRNGNTTIPTGTQNSPEDKAQRRQVRQVPNKSIHVSAGANFRATHMSGYDRPYGETLWRKPFWATHMSGGVRPYGETIAAFVDTTHTAYRRQHIPYTDGIGTQTDQAGANLRATHKSGYVRPYGETSGANPSGLRIRAGATAPTGRPMHHHSVCTKRTGRQYSTMRIQ